MVLLDANKMLDHSGQADANEDIQRTKEKLNALFQREYSSMEEFAAAVAPMQTTSILNALKSIKNPLEALNRLHELIRKMKCEVAEFALDKRENSAVHWTVVSENLALTRCIRC